MSEPLPRAALVRSAEQRAVPWLAALAAILVVLVARTCMYEARLAPIAGDAGDPPGTTAWHGSLALPRGGPYIVGFQSPGPAVLALDAGGLPPRTPNVMAGRGVVTRRLLLGTPAAVDGARDVIGIRFAAPPGARLLWLPPGRRGEPEYVPAGALSPAPPGLARFDHPDRALGDAATSTAIVVIVLALAGWLSRHRVRGTPRAILVGTLAVLALALIVRVESLGDAGQTWDEDTYWSAGRNYIHNLVTLDFAQDSWIWNQQHPPVSKYLAGLGAWWSDGYGPARAVSALVMALACALLVPIGARLHRPATGIAAGVVAALTPHLVAHGQIVGHEAPTALAWMLALWTSLRVWDGIEELPSTVRPERRPRETRPDPTSVHPERRPRETRSDPTSVHPERRPSEARPDPTSVHPERRPSEARPESKGEATIRRRLIARMAIVGVVLGVAVMVRFVNVLAAPAIGLTIVIGAPRGRRVQAILLGLAVIPAAAALTSIALWPRLWSHPIAHLDEAWARLKGTHSREPFLGTLTSTPPRWYFLVYLGATAPLGLLVAAVAGKLAWLRDRAHRRSLVIVAVWALAPFGVIFSPVRQDGVRYIIPTLALLALLAGAGVVAIGDAVARRWPRPRWLHLAPAALLALYLAVVCVRIRPYYLDYYGEQVGGTASVARTRRFEVAWWGEGVGAAIDHVNRHAAPGDRVHRRCVEPGHLTWLRGDLWETVDDPRAARWLVHYQPSWRACPLPPGAVRVFTVRAGGAPLAHVYRIDPPAGGATP